MLPQQQVRLVAPTVAVEVGDAVVTGIDWRYVPAAALGGDDLRSSTGAVLHCHQIRMVALVHIHKSHLLHVSATGEFTPSAVHMAGFLSVSLVSEDPAHGGIGAHGE